ncbi:MAG: helix-turn-helix domain-containing protein [Bifidobacteriaceae bacterium]|jgi:predicted nucleotidyltransferase|nr:helix-turn-helix domain-containing protein [Bifidobacteriaceae bacterium]
MLGLVDDQNYARRVRVRRNAAGLSQRQLASLTGVRQPYIAQIEAGQRIPAGSTRQAIGRVLDLRPAALLRLLADDVERTVAKSGASNPRVFGSVARGSDQPGSDIDLVVSFPPAASIIEVLALEEELSALLTVPVDVVADSGAGPAMERVLAEAVPL